MRSTNKGQERAALQTNCKGAQGMQLPVLARLVMRQAAAHVDASTYQNMVVVGSVKVCSVQQRDPAGQGFLYNRDSVNFWPDVALAAVETFC